MLSSEGVVFQQSPIFTVSREVDETLNCFHLSWCACHVTHLKLVILRKFDGRDWALICKSVVPQHND